jgi:hypothetical protein
MANPYLPTFLTPSASGLLSNTLGSNTTTDKIALTAHYQNPAGSSDGIACMRMVISQIAQQAGDPLSPTVLWDSGWSGVPAVESIPGIASETGSPITATWAGRVYVMFAGQSGSNFGSGNVWSAPLTAGGVGAWRQENGLGATSQWFSVGAQGVQSYYSGCTQMAAVNNWLYACVAPANTVSVVANVLAAPIAGDGRLGAWQYMATAPYSLHSNGMMCIGRSNRTTPGPATVPGNMFIMGGYNTSNAQVGSCYSTYVNADGTLQAATDGWFAQAPIDPGGGTRQNAQCYYDDNYPNIYIVGGDSGTTPASSTLSGAVSNQDIVTWGTATNGALPTGKTLGALVVTLGPDYATHFWYLGGCSTTSGTQTTTVYHNSLSAPGAFTAAWSTSTLTLSSVPGTSNWAPQLVAFSGSTPGKAGLGGSSRLAAPGIVGPGSSIFEGSYPAQIGETGGVSTSGASNTDPTALPWIAYMYVGSATRACSPHDGSPTWRTGDAPGLAVADIGASLATITTNGDGSQDIAVTYRGWGGIHALNANGAYNGGVAGANGYQLQIAVQYTSKKGGVSPVAYTSLKLGQPPTLSSIAPSGTIANGQPTASFGYTPGAGGDVEYQYQIQVKQGSTVIFDTGVRYDSLNSALLTIAPLLAPSTTYTLVITASSRDVPASGSTDTVTSSTSFTTSAFTLPGTP